MNETIEDYKEEVQLMIQSGLYSLEDIFFQMESVDITDQKSIEALTSRFNHHNTHKTNSVDVTKLYNLFDELSREGFITLHNAGYTSSDFFEDLDQAIYSVKKKPFGYIGYNEQDLDRAIHMSTLTLSFGAFINSEETQSNGMNKTEIGEYFKTKLEEKGLTVEWNGKGDSKLFLVNFNYTKVFDQEDWSMNRTIQLINQSSNL